MGSNSKYTGRLGEHLGRASVVILLAELQLQMGMH